MTGLIHRRAKRWNLEILNLNCLGGRKVPFWRNLVLQPKTAFLRFPPVHRAGPEGQQKVDLTFSRAVGE
jgi:hypothetical protein